MKKLVLFTLSFVLFSSCIQEGCTDPAALNYSSSAISDDGSCILEQDVQNLYVENFTLSFDNSTSLDLYIPNFIYEAGDMIIIETVNSFDEWTALPYIFGVDIHIVGSYEEDGTVWISLNNDDGTGYFPSQILTIQFRVGLIKQSGLIINPNLEFMTIDELSSSI
jgi:hypothetical protein